MREPAIEHLKNAAQVLQLEIVNQTPLTVPEMLALLVAVRDRVAVAIEQIDQYREAVEKSAADPAIMSYRRDIKTFYHLVTGREFPNGR